MACIVGSAVAFDSWFVAVVCCGLDFLDNSLVAVWCASGFIGKFKSTWCFILSGDTMQGLEAIEKMHREIMWTVVRIRAKSAWGSGTLIYSKSDAKGIFHTYVLTCYHVVESNIEVSTKWEPLVGMEVKKEVRTPVEVEMFYYENLSHAKGIAGSYRANIVAYDADQDIALLELDKTTETQPVCYLFPKDAIDEIHVFDEVYACGAAMGHEPIVTSGMINFMDEIIDNYTYWLSTAPTIFGNSGGAVFRYSPQRGRYEFIGMPARIAVTIVGFSSSPITHMGWFVPITRIYDFLEKNFYQFIFDERYTYEKCEELRKAAEEEAKKLFMAKYGAIDVREKMKAK